MDPLKHSTTTVVGIDLGTTNCALAYWQPEFDADSRSNQAPIKALPIAQLTAPDQVSRCPTLPSFLYVPHAGETPVAALSFETPLSPAGIVGTWARERGVLVPDRVISSAKSWLCSGAIDRRAAVLPWKSEMGDGKCSPVAASTRYLAHLMAAYRDDIGAGEGPPTVVLTVPASFDEVARALTYEAASLAGLSQPTLLEEPLAAFYAWLDANPDNWRESVAPGDVVLVCDVGGGTCDFSMIAVTEEAGELRLERISVGDHLLLGGDNMDLALAHTLRLQLEATGKKLDQWQFLSLVGAARAAKEQLLSDGALTAVPIGIASRSASLFASTLSTELTASQVHAVLVEGFLPLTKIDSAPLPRRSLGFQEVGLHYESDAAISRHLARFLQRSGQNISANAQLQTLLGPRLVPGQTHLMPTAVLFNGGVFKADAMRQRVMALLNSWDHTGSGVKELSGSDSELAVARGAAYYGRMRATGVGIRVQSGTARSFYVGLDEPALAIPGYEPPVKGLCLVPQGTGEGTEIALAAQQFGLVVGEPVDFRFFSSAVRAGDAAGTMIADAPSELDESSRLSMTLTADGYSQGDIVPVQLNAAIDETGMLQLYMLDVASQHRWKLEFNVRAHDHG